MQDFIDSAESRETSTEIMEAIAWLARNEAEAVRIWEDPTEAEVNAIRERVTGNGRTDPEDYCWGEDGHEWAGRTQAEKIADGSADSAQAMEMAEADDLLSDTFQDWANETTVFTFTDGSELMVSGPDYHAKAAQ